MHILDVVNHVHYSTASFINDPTPTYRWLLALRTSRQL